MIKINTTINFYQFSSIVKSRILREAEFPKIFSIFAIYENEILAIFTSEKKIVYNFSS